MSAENDRERDERKKKGERRYVEYFCPWLKRVMVWVCGGDIALRCGAYKNDCVF